MPVFFTFHHFCEKTYAKTWQFHDLFSKFLLLCARSQIFVIWKYFAKICRPSQNVKNLLLISTTLSNVYDKTYEKTCLFFYIYIFKLSLYFYVFIKFHYYKISKNEMPSVLICQQNLLYSSNFEQYFGRKILQFL